CVAHIGADPEHLGEFDVAGSLHGPFARRKLVAEGHEQRVMVEHLAPLHERIVADGPCDVGKTSEALDAAEPQFAMGQPDPGVGRPEDQFVKDVKHWCVGGKNCAGMCMTQSGRVNPTEAPKRSAASGALPWQEAV